MYYNMKYQRGQNGTVGTEKQTGWTYRVLDGTGIDGKRYHVRIRASNVLDNDFV